jgi:hypothetical protein
MDNSDDLGSACGRQRGRQPISEVLRCTHGFVALSETQRSVGPDHRQAGVIRQIAHFMNVGLDTVQLEAVTRAATFEQMRRLTDRFDPGRLVPWGKAHSMLRRGTPGGSGELLSPELRQRIDEHSRTELRRLQCDFPYDLAYVKGQSVLPICGGH